MSYISTSMTINLIKIINFYFNNIKVLYINNIFYVILCFLLKYDVIRI